MRTRCSDFEVQVRREWRERLGRVARINRFRRPFRTRRVWGRIRGCSLAVLARPPANFRLSRWDKQCIASFGMLSERGLKVIRFWRPFRARRVGGRSGGFRRPHMFGLALWAKHGSASFGMLSAEMTRWKRRSDAEWCRRLLSEVSRRTDWCTEPPGKMPDGATGGTPVPRAMPAHALPHRSGLDLPTSI